MNNNELEVDVAILKEQMKETRTDVEEMKDTIKIIHDLTYSVKDMCREIQNNNSKLDDVSARLEAIEKEPVEDMKSAKRKVKEYILTTLVGMVITILGVALVELIKSGLVG